MMNNPWEFGWEAIGAIFGVLAVVIVIVLEWDKLVESKAFPRLVAVGVLVAFGVGIGFAISQELLWWRVAGVVLAVVLGALLGAALSSEGSRKGGIAISLLAAIVGAIMGLSWASSI